MSYHEPKDPRTDKAPMHQQAALGKKISNAEVMPIKEADVSEFNDESVKETFLNIDVKNYTNISNVEIAPSDYEIFNHENIEEIKEQFKNGLNFPYVYVRHFGDAIIVINISNTPKSEWYDEVHPNSEYAYIHVSNKGVVTQHSGWEMYLRKFKGKNIEDIIQKINAIIQEK